MDGAEALETLVRTIFHDLPPIADAELAVRFSRDPEWWAQYLAHVLKKWRNRTPYESLDSLRCQDEDMIYRVSGFARWYFAPTFMIMALRGLGQFEFHYLLNVFKYSRTTLLNAGVPADCIDTEGVPIGDDWIETSGLNESAMKPQSVWHDMPIESFPPATQQRTSELDITGVQRARPCGRPSR